MLADAGLIHVPPTEQRFLTRDPPDSRLWVHGAGLPPVHQRGCLFASGGLWSLYDDGGKPMIVLRAAGQPERPYGVAIFSPDFATGDLHYDERCEAQRRWPLAHPLHELVVVNLLAQGRGVLFHAAAIRDAGRGALLAGKSGAGKSTLARLFSQRRGITVLSDEHVVVRRGEDGFRVYGTPWGAGPNLSAAASAVLTHVFVLEHGRPNLARPMARGAAAAALLARTVATLWDREGMAFTAQFVGDMVRVLPCYTFGFVPDGTAVDYLRCLMSD